ncbi:hypothetical protein [Streptomyces sp. NPDC096142]|uniref:hypothetical protein n=1 Tax=Streptomyces sp. NPDC096142 TaxID=3366077 RepID=UPI00380248D7
MAVSLRHIAVDAHDLPGLARFRAVGRVVLADPEGNECRVLRPKTSLTAFRDTPR